MRKAMTDHQLNRLYSAIVAAVVLALLGTASFAQQPPPPDLDAYTARVLKEFEVPGVAVAIVKDGKVIGIFIGAAAE